MALFCPHSTSRTSSPSLKTGLTRSSFCSEPPAWLDDDLEVLILGLTGFMLLLLDGGLLLLLFVLLLFVDLFPGDEGVFWCALATLAVLLLAVITFPLTCGLKLIPAIPTVCCCCCTGKEMWPLMFRVLVATAIVVVGGRQFAVWTAMGVTTVGMIVDATTAWASCADCCILTTGIAGHKPDTAATTDTTGIVALLLLSSAGLRSPVPSEIENCWKGMKVWEAGI